MSENYRMDLGINEADVNETLASVNGKVVATEKTMELIGEEIRVEALHLAKKIQGVSVGDGIYKAINQVMKNIEAIGKGRESGGYGDNKFKFRGIDDLYNELHKHMADAGVFSVPRVLSRTENPYVTAKGAHMLRVVLQIEYDFTATDGSKVTVGPVYGEAADSGDKATNKAFSIAHKYCLLQLFMIPTEDDKDPDATIPEPPGSPSRAQSKPQASKPKDPPPAPPPSAEKKEVLNHAPSGAGKPSELQIKLMFTIGKKNDWTPEQIQELMKSQLGKETTKDITLEEYNNLCDFMQKHKYPEWKQIQEQK